MPTKTINLNLELCDSRAILTYPEDGAKYAYSDETEACRSIANDIEYIIKEQLHNKYQIKIEITPI